MTKNPGRILAISLIALVGSVLFIQKTWLNGFVMMFRANPAFFLGILILGVLVVAAFVASEAGNGFRLPTIIGSVLTVIALIFMLFWAGYAKAKQVNEAAEILEPKDGIAAFDTFKNRAPYTVAEQQTADNTTINGTPGLTTYIPALDKFGAPVVKKGMFQGYGQVVWQSIGDTGQAKVTPCTFSKNAARRLGGKFSHNLERKIIGEDFAIKIDSQDSYAYCTDEGDPMVVVPFTKYKGFLFPIEVPAGVAIYNGSTGDLSIRYDLKEGDIPGPVYPISLSQAALKATTAADGFVSWIQKRTGYQAYGGENDADYLLRKMDDSGDAFVTPLAMKGRGKAITAVASVSSTDFTPGKLNAYKIAKLPEPRQGNSAVNDRVKSDYGDLNWASGLEIFEIAPTGPKTWAATIGLRKSIVFRLEINADGSSCLFSVKGEKLRCTNDEPTAEGEGAAGGEEDALSLAGMSDKDLIKLQKRVTDELGKRLAAK